MREFVLFRDLNDEQAQKVLSCLRRHYNDLVFSVLYEGTQQAITVQSNGFMNRDLAHEFTMYILGILAGMETD